MNERVDTLSADVARAEKQPGSAEADRRVAEVRADKAETAIAAERDRAEALRTAIDELKAVQALMKDVQAEQQAAAVLRQAEDRPERREGLWRVSRRCGEGVKAASRRDRCDPCPRQRSSGPSRRPCDGQCGAAWRYSPGRGPPLFNPAEKKCLPPPATSVIFGGGLFLELAERYTALARTLAQSSDFEISSSLTTIATRL